MKWLPPPTDPSCGNDLGVGALDRVEVGALGDLDVLALAEVAPTPIALAPWRRISSAFLRREARHARGAMRADAGRHARFDRGHPARARVPIGDPVGAEAGDAHVQDAARDVVTGAGLNDRVFGDDHAADRHAVAGVRIGHQVRADHARVRRRGGELLPHRLLGRLEQRLGEERVRVHAHAARTRQHVVVLADFLSVILE